MLALYWPVFSQLRFFWEDFFVWEYPIRDYSFYMLGWKHSLPFWNPYSWTLPAILADAQNGFWYPTNLLGIAFTRVLFPTLHHLPVVVTEFLTIAHYPFAALGMFYLLRRHFRISSIAAFIAGFTYGFGSRIIADQNHPMWVYQLALLPWATLLLFRSWNSWPPAIGLGLVLGLGLLAGHPQVFLFTSFFFFCFAIAEVVTRYRESNNSLQALRPFFSYAVSIAIACAFAAIQLFPSIEFSLNSARSHLDYYSASRFALHPAGLFVFLAPRVLREPGDIASMHDPQQAIFYWSALAEILALFALVVLWKYRRDLKDVRTRHLRFVLIFSSFAMGFALGPYFPVQWIFWRFIPLFNQVRAPARMLWFFWLLGTIYGGIGLDILLKDPKEAVHRRKLLVWLGIIFVFANIVAATGLLDYTFFPHHFVRPGIVLLIAPSIIVTLLVLRFILLIVHGNVPSSRIAIFAAILIIGDLYLQDFNQHRNTISRDQLTKEDSTNTNVRAFFDEHPNDHAKLLWLRERSLYGLRENTGMILRLPIEDAEDSVRVVDINPMRISPLFPLVKDSITRMKIMGVKAVIDPENRVMNYPDALPFVKFYNDWKAIPSDSEARTAYLDTSFDFHRTIILDRSPGFVPGSGNSNDTGILSSFSENELEATTHSTNGGILFINDLYYPAWHATIDGQPTKIMRAFTSLRAVAVPAGNHRVRLQYADAEFEIGWKITVLTIILAVLGFLLLPKMEAKTEGPRRRIAPRSGSLDLK